jgi:hypothetical protein
VIELLKGSIVCGKSGKPLQVLAIDGEKVVVKSGEDLLRVDRSKILQVLTPPLPKTTGIEIGDRLKRKPQTQTKYPKAWFPQGSDPRQPMIDAIESATVEQISLDGYWVRNPIGEVYHISESSIKEGAWELISRYQQN